jgi:hypothetical protein
MARKKSYGKAVEAQRQYLEGVAKKMADELWGPKGPAWGTTLTEMEDLALAARAIFTEKLLALGLERQATTLQTEPPAAAAACPDCHRPIEEAAEAAPREMHTRGGDVAWREPRAYCTRCRRAFFPSEQKSGD